VNMKIHYFQYLFSHIFVSSSYTTQKRRFAMLDTLLAAEENNEIDNDGIREEVDTFMFEGHDTTSSGLTFSLLLIATHNDVQKKIFAEIQNALG
jgi:cytochrome P450 family 4